MTQFPLDARVAVRPIAQQREGQSVTIGDLGRQVFLTIPTEGMDILSALAAGRTVGEAVALYEQTHHQTPDVEDFLSALADEGFVAPWGDEAFAEEVRQSAAPSLGRISPAVARRLFGAPVLGVCALVVCAAVALLVSDPGVMPGPGALVFHHHLAALSLGMFAVTAAGVTVHELGHLLAARASGVPAKIGLGHRLWFVVVETDMTGIWMVPKRRRYLAFLAGPIIDVVCAAVLVGVLWAQSRGWIGLSPVLAQFTGAVLFSYLLRVLWQCFVFVRTDFYFVIATALDCKRLLADTEDLLRNHWTRLRGRAVLVDQSAIPPHEMRAVRAYSVVWVVGRVVALASLVLVTLPVLTGYGAEVFRAVSGGHSSYDTADLLTLAVLGLTVQGAGLVVWIRSLHRGRTQRRTDALANA
ncbi:MAG: putative peptide zinc metalloprotease protein [Solirubrobacteraceae bacterium]|nr:putative peptide zinc metalloprotease protein [Solirubrobacteraceae bacterium]